MRKSLNIKLCGKRKKGKSWEAVFSSSSLTVLKSERKREAICFEKWKLFLVEDVQHVEDGERMCKTD